MVTTAQPPFIDIYQCIYMIPWISISVKGIFDGRRCCCYNSFMLDLSPFVNEEKEGLA